MQLLSLVVILIVVLFVLGWSNSILYDVLK